MKVEKMCMKACYTIFQASRSNTAVTVTVCCESGVRDCFLIPWTPGAPGRGPDALAQGVGAHPSLCVSRKNAVELELAKCKMDMMSLNSQLLDAIQQKLSLSQQLEAWQVKESVNPG